MVLLPRQPCLLVSCSLISIILLLMDMMMSYVELGWTKLISLYVCVCVYLWIVWFFHLIDFNGSIISNVIYMVK